MSTRSTTGIGLNDLLEAQTNDQGMFNGDMAASCNTLLADHIISLVQPYLPPTHQPIRILDNTSGPAVVATRCFANTAITDHAALHISAVDISSDFVPNNRSLIAQMPVWTSNGTLVDTAVMDGTKPSLRCQCLRRLLHQPSHLRLLRLRQRCRRAEAYA